jgi:hypothetical protein
MPSSTDDGQSTSAKNMSKQSMQCKAQGRKNSMECEEIDYGLINRQNKDAVVMCAHCCVAKLTMCMTSF